MRKKLLVIMVMILSAVVILGMTACGGESGNSDDGSTAPDEGAVGRILDVGDDPFCVMPGDCDSRGYLELRCDQAGEYSFKAVNKKGYNIKWNIYVMDEKYPDATRYISESETPALTGNGKLQLREKQYIYVQCSANSFTSDEGELPVDSYLEIGFDD